MEMKDVRLEIARHHAEMTALRRDIHMHPETSYEEFRTSALVQEKLREWGIEYHTGLGVRPWGKPNGPGPAPPRSRARSCANRL